jgi:glycosyltransferase involved in cell wall biosynthesis
VTRGRHTFSVLTAAYAARPVLGRLYESLERQTFRDFEWLVVDDGSEDGTGEVVAGWTKAAPFPIRYLWQPHSGKHVAINRGVEQAPGSFCAIMDADDWYAPNALERMLHHWNSIPPTQRERFASVEGLAAFADGGLVGSSFPADIFDSDTFEVRALHKVVGDTVGMYRTDVLRRYPYPENLGEAYVTEGIVWNRIALRYRSRFVNEVLGYKEYLPTGISVGLRSAEKVVVASKGFLLYHEELLSSGRSMPWSVRLRSYANYVRYSLHQGVGLPRQAAAARSRALWCLVLPVGVALYLRDRLGVRRAAD